MSDLNKEGSTVKATVLVNQPTELVLCKERKFLRQRSSLIQSNQTSLLKAVALSRVISTHIDRMRNGYYDDVNCYAVTFPDVEILNLS